jgi:hypothetical protein
LSFVCVIFLGVLGVAERIQNGLTKFGPHVRMASQIEEGRAEQAGGCIAPR